MSAGKGDKIRPYSKKAYDACPLWDSCKKGNLPAFRGNADKPEPSKDRESWRKNRP